LIHRYPVIYNPNRKDWIPIHQVSYGRRFSTTRDSRGSVFCTELLRSFKLL